MNSVSFTESVSLGVFHGWNPDRLFVILTAYIDESGTHDASARTVVGGMVGRASELAELDRIWVALLASQGLTHLHGVDLFNRKKQFKTWPLNRVAFVARFAAALTESYFDFGVMSVLYNSDYDMTYARGTWPKGVRRDSKYGLALRYCLSSIAYMARRKEYGTAPQISVIIEAGHRNIGDADRIFSEVKEQDVDGARGLFQGLTIANKRDVPGLQVVDLVAHELYKTEDSPAESLDLLLDDGKPITLSAPVARVPITAGELAAHKESLFAAAQAKRTLAGRVV